MKNTIDLSGKNAMITGASRGIGAGITRAMAACGANLIINYFRDKENAEALAEELKAKGAVINGFYRDTPMVLEQHWPVFGRGRYAHSGVRTQVADYRCTIEIESVWITPGDLIFGDLDGVLVIPKKVEREAVLRALNKARGEKLVRKEIENGMSSSMAFSKYGVL